MDKLVFYMLSGTYVGQVEDWHYALVDAELVNANYERARQIAASNDAELPSTRVLTLIAGMNRPEFNGKEFWSADRSTVFPSRVKTCVLLNGSVYESATRDTNWRTVILVRRFAATVECL